MILVAALSCAHGGEGAAALSASAGAPGPAPAAEEAWRPAEARDVPEALRAAWGHEPELFGLVDLDGDGNLDAVCIEVEEGSRRARVRLVAGPVLGELPVQAEGPLLTTGLKVHPPGTLPLRDRAPAELTALAAGLGVVEWCLAPPRHPWSPGLACYGAGLALVDGEGRVLRFEVWD